MKRLIALVIPLALLVTVAAFGFQVPQEWKHRQFMRQKLDHSQKVLEGIVVEDFDQVADGAKMLSLLSKVAEFQVLPSADYRRYSEEFRRTADELAQMAQEKNLDGSALKYVELTMNCVNCHKYVRNVRLAELGGQDDTADNAEVIDLFLKNGRAELRKNHEPPQQK